MSELSCETSHPIFNGRDEELIRMATTVPGLAEQDLAPVDDQVGIPRQSPLSERVCGDAGVLRALGEQGKKLIDLLEADGTVRDVSTGAACLMIGATTLALVGGLHTRPRGTKKGWTAARKAEIKAYEAMKGITDPVEAKKAEDRAAKASRKRAKLEED